MSDLPPSKIGSLVSLVAKLIHKCTSVKNKNKNTGGSATETVKEIISRFKPHKNYLGNTKTQDTKQIKNASVKDTFALNTKEKSKATGNWRGPGTPRAPSPSGDAGPGWTCSRRPAPPRTRVPLAGRAAIQRPQSERTTSPRRAARSARGLGRGRDERGAPAVRAWLRDPRRPGTPGPRRGRVRPPSRPVPTGRPLRRHSLLALRGQGRACRRRARHRPGSRPSRPPLTCPRRAPRLRAPRAAARAAAAAAPPAPASAAAPTPSWLRSEVTSGGSRRGPGNPHRPRRRRGPRPRAAPVPAPPDAHARKTPGRCGRDPGPRCRPSDSRWPGHTGGDTADSGGQRPRLATTSLTAPRGLNFARLKVTTGIRSLWREKKNGLSLSFCQINIDPIVDSSPKDQSSITQKAQARRGQIHLDLFAYSLRTSIYCPPAMCPASTGLGAAATYGPEHDLGLVLVELTIYKRGSKSISVGG